MAVDDLDQDREGFVQSLDDVRRRAFARRDPAGTLDSSAYQR
jgi:hypothetical protein